MKSSYLIVFGTMDGSYDILTAKSLKKLNKKIRKAIDIGDIDPDYFEPDIFVIDGEITNIDLTQETFIQLS